MLEFIIPSCILYQVHKTSVVAKLIFINALICMCKGPCPHTIIGFTIHVSIFFAPMRLRIYRFDWFCLELMQKHWVLILHLKTKYINRCQFIWWTIRQRLLAFLSLSSIASPEIIFSLPKSYFQIANSPIKEEKEKPKGNDLTYLI